MKEIEQLAIKVFRKKYLHQIFVYVISKKKIFQYEIKKNTKIKYDSHVSTAMREMRELGLIKCDNPEDANYKVYEATEKAWKLKEEIKKFEE